MRRTLLLAWLVARRRLLSNMPESTVHGGPRPQESAAARPMTVTTLRGKHHRGEPISMVTAYDYSPAVHVDSAGVDVVLVGDSAAMVAHGHDNILPVSLDLMLQHCRAVVRGAPRPLVVGDLPFGSYESSPAQAVESAVRLMKEGGVDAVTMEGGAASRVGAAREIEDAGIAVMGHVGLTPQAISVLGGFRAQGKTVDGALKVVEAALVLQDAGCFAVVLECVPAPVAPAATAALQIPTIGVGAGPLCSGQALVYHDLLGMFQSPEHSKVTPKYGKQFGDVGAAIGMALAEYRQQVEARAFPDADHTPYKISSVDVDAFADALRNVGFDGAAAAAAAAAAAKTEKIVGDGMPQEGDNINDGILSNAGDAAV